MPDLHNDFAKRNGHCSCSLLRQRRPQRLHLLRNLRLDRRQLIQQFPRIAVLDLRPGSSAGSARPTD